MSRQFTDGEVVAAIRAIAAEAAPLSRASVRKRLGGGGSTRISAILKEYAARLSAPAVLFVLVPDDIEISSSPYGARLPSTS